jgi:hypothetical protein
MPEKAKTSMPAKQAGMKYLQPHSVIVLVTMLMVTTMIMATSTICAMLMGYCAMLVIIMSLNPVIMICMIMIRVVMAAIGTVLVPMIIGTALRLERTHYFNKRATLPSHHFGKHMVMRDIDRINRDLGRRVPISDMPSHSEQSQRVLGTDFHEPFWRGGNTDQAAIFQF